MMKSLKISLITAACAFFIFACSQNQSPAAKDANTIKIANDAVAAANNPPPEMLDELASARKNYAQNCVQCHKEGGIGGASVIDGKHLKAPNFTSQRMIKDKDADWIDSIENGIEDEGMPAFKDKLSAQEIKDLVKLIRKDFQKQ
ncbi:MAG: cytochrome c [Acidobacteriota bacterium]|nr:cytochrome c [Acidobacteriota bacterium]